MHRHILSLLSFVFLLFACAPIAAYSVPFKSPSGTDRQSSPTHPYQADPKYNFRSVFPQLTWIRDASALKVAGVFDAFYSLSGRWGLSQKTAKAGLDKQTLPRPSNVQLPANLLAKYGGDVVLRFNLSTPLEEKALAEAADTLFLDIWAFTSNWADIRLREDDVSSLLGLLPKSLQTAYSHLMPDLARTIYESYPSITFPRPEKTTHHQSGAFTPRLKASDGPDNIFFRDYQPFSVIVPWMRLMESMFRTHVRMISIGTTYEGRDIPALKIGVSPNLPQDPSSKPRKTIIISGGVHAREWISVSTVTYIAWSLITSYGSSSEIDKLLQEFDFIMIPTTNPDGYVYTWETDRLWRKNRQQTSLRFCQGLDLDRGFGYEWDGTSYQSNPCSESYPGDEPFQAVESHRIAEWAKNETDNNNVKFVGFLDLHSYSQQVLYPYSYSCQSDPPSLENLTELGIGLARAIRRSSGEFYIVNSACEGSVPWNKKDTVHARMESAGGSAIDWFYHEMGVRYSYQIKLRDTGSYGFLLPSENIVPTGQETFEAVKYFGRYLLGDNGIESIENTVKAKPEIVLDRDNETEVGAEADAEEELEEWKWDLRRRRR